MVAPTMVAAMPTAPIWPMREARWLRGARLKAIVFVTGMSRWLPALQITMKAIMSAYLSPVKARPAMPRAMPRAERTPSLLSERKKRTPPMTVTRKPGSSRGNSSLPRASAVMANVSFR